eukprot:TRINITY_DN15217_c0_g2_i5.p1 TRINITY_DN15217_c0_g2~~TRINITY_DN15217_c0_g2_i5.p1  ORF type:complete len:219 (+),score=28.34 TRINITY_DN15217_c0_g2_i5:65-658(+)
MALRRKVGVGGLEQHRKAREGFRAVGKQIEESQLEHMKKQLDIFKENLEKFASEHKYEINRNPVFRRQFQEMCTKIGVDPLASRKGFWSEILGMGDFYYELGVQIVEIGISTRAQNGGLLRLSDLLARLRKKRGRNAQDISEDDVLRAISKIGDLGNGYQILTVGQGPASEKILLTVPCELNTDHSQILGMAQVGFV